MKNLNKPTVLEYALVLIAIGIIVCIPGFFGYVIGLAVVVFVVWKSGFIFKK